MQGAEGQPLSAGEVAGTGGGSTCGWGRDHLTPAQFHCNKAGQDGVEEVGSSRPDGLLLLEGPYEHFCKYHLQSYVYSLHNVSSEMKGCIEVYTPERTNTRSSSYV